MSSSVSLVLVRLRDSRRPTSIQSTHGKHHPAGGRSRCDPIGIAPYPCLRGGCCWRGMRPLLLWRVDVISGDAESRCPLLSIMTTASPSRRLRDFPPRPFAGSRFVKGFQLRPQLHGRLVIALPGFLVDGWEHQQPSPQEACRNETGPHGRWSRPTPRRRQTQQPTLTDGRVYAVCTSRARRRPPPAPGPPSKKARGLGLRGGQRCSDPRRSSLGIRCSIHLSYEGEGRTGAYYQAWRRRRNGEMCMVDVHERVIRPPGAE